MGIALIILLVNAQFTRDKLQHLTLRTDYLVTCAAEREIQESKTVDEKLAKINIDIVIELVSGSPEQVIEKFKQMHSYRIRKIGPALVLIVAPLTERDQIWMDVKQIEADISLNLLKDSSELFMIPSISK
jgi:hypothetical protein